MCTWHKKTNTNLGILNANIWDSEFEIGAYCPMNSLHVWRIKWNMKSRFSLLFTKFPYVLILKERNASNGKKKTFVHVDICLTTYLPYVDNRGHLTDHLPTSSCPRSLWTTPNFNPRFLIYQDRKSLNYLFQNQMLKFKISHLNTIQTSTKVSFEHNHFQA